MKMTIYLKREPNENDDWGKHRFFGKIGIYYDKPVGDCLGRKIGEAPAYMYPKLIPNECIEMTYERDFESMTDYEKLRIE